jgi:hypothetical protein
MTLPILNFAVLMKRSTKFPLLTPFALFLNAQLNAQAPPQLVPPAPNAAALAQYADIPVSKYSGVPNISIPISTINTGAYQLLISVSCHA